MKLSADIIDLLESEAGRINRPSFIDEDPVQFPRRFDKLQDIEIAGLLTAMISWGRRPMILRDADRMLGLMDHQPYSYVMEQGYDDFDSDRNIHRTFFGRHFKWILRTLREIYSKHKSLDSFSMSLNVGDDSAPAWKLVDAMNKIGYDVNGCACQECLPTNLRATALKRINMALRWFVRNDGIVDMGVWKSISPAQLFLPLDVHVGNTARELGLLSRKSNDRRSVEELTELMRSIRPDDPVFFDYALFGIGVTGGLKSLS